MGEVAVEVVLDEEIQEINVIFTFSSEVNSRATAPFDVAGLDEKEVELDEEELLPPRLSSADGPCIFSDYYLERELLSNIVQTTTTTTSIKKQQKNISQYPPRHSFVSTRTSSNDSNLRHYCLKKNKRTNTLINIPLCVSVMNIQCAKDTCKWNSTAEPD